MVLASLFIGGDPAGKFGGFDMHQDVAAGLLILRPPLFPVNAELIPQTTPKKSGVFFSCGLFGSRCR